jgi:hypothetical protein
MRELQSRLIVIVAIAQVVPLLLFPWPLSLGSAIIALLLIALCAFLGWALIERKAWGRTLTIFVQGLNIIVRIMTLFSNVYDSDLGLDVAFLITYVLSIVASAVLLSYVDRPEVQLMFEA